MELKDFGHFGRTMKACPKCGGRNFKKTHEGDTTIKFGEIEFGILFVGCIDCGYIFGATRCMNDKKMQCAKCKQECYLDQLIVNETLNGTVRQCPTCKEEWEFPEEKE